MRQRILIVTNDNVFYLLLSTFIESASSFVVCEKTSDPDVFQSHAADDVKLIIVDGKLIDVSPVELIYQARYHFNILCNIWFITEIRSLNYLQKVLEVGANRIIQKPFDPYELSREIISSV